MPVEKNLKSPFGSLSGRMPTTFSCLGRAVSPWGNFYIVRVGESSEPPKGVNMPACGSRES